MADAPTDASREGAAGTPAGEVRDALSWEKPAFNREILRRYDRPGPRYTSYPTANLFHEGFTAGDYEAAVLASDREAPDRPLSIYVHLPFCGTPCTFCACNVIWTHKRDRDAWYVDLVGREIERVSALLSRGRKVVQLHWGGGTPTHTPAPILARLVDYLRANLDFADDIEMGIELNPREIDPDHLEVLQRCGFNRASMGVQDLDKQVQAAVHRIQTKDQTAAVLEECRERGFQSINMDLIYGLPHQTKESFARTVDEIARLGPDRIALFNFAYLPQMFRHHRAIDPATLPSPDTKLDILELAIEGFTEAGYVYIGMDHFARPDDELTVAMSERTLTRNFQGYSTRLGCDMLAFGVSAISQVGRCYAQNHKTLEGYEPRVARGEIPTERGILLTDDDVLRREVIRRLMCHFVVVKSEIEGKFGIDFDRDFADGIRALEPMAADGLVALGDDRVTVLPLGRLLVRNIAMAFDAHLKPATQAGFSRTV
ncbi:MAG: oxygen-independent coproporphyrinogen III oxidase [Deltaproteobacteria bacterium]|nr:oxygen-independent coproporphyrinogen III oxidase [Deltaproteobacteria bacterium]